MTIEHLGGHTDLLAEVGDARPLVAPLREATGSRLQDGYTCSLALPGHQIDAIARRGFDAVLQPGTDGFEAEPLLLQPDDLTQQVHVRPVVDGPGGAGLLGRGQ